MRSCLKTLLPGYIGTFLLRNSLLFNYFYVRGEALSRLVYKRDFCREIMCDFPLLMDVKEWTITKALIMYQKKFAAKIAHVSGSMLRNYDAYA